MGPIRPHGTTYAPTSDSLSTTATPEHSCLQPTHMRSRSSITTLSPGGHLPHIHSIPCHEPHYSSSEAWNSAHLLWSQDQMPCGARASYSAPLPWLNAVSNHTMCDLGVQLSCSLEEEDNVHLGLASCCRASLPACSAASHNNEHAACFKNIHSGDCGLHAHQHQQLASSSSSTAVANRQCALCPISEDNSLQSSSQRSCSKPLSQQHDSCTALWREQGRSNLAGSSMFGIPSVGQQQQQHLQLQDLLTGVSDSLMQIEEEIVQLLLMTQQLSAAASAATPGTPVAAACAAALRMHDATLTRALETRDALEQAVIAAAATAAAAAQENEDNEEARAMLWHPNAAVMGWHGWPHAAAAATTCGMMSPRQHADAWLAIGDSTAEDYSWQQQQQQQLYRQKQDLACHYQQRQQACMSAPVLMGPAIQLDASLEGTRHQTAAAAASHKQPEVDVQLLQLLSMV